MCYSLSDVSIWAIFIAISAQNKYEYPPTQDGTRSVDYGFLCPQGGKKFSKTITLDLSKREAVPHNPHGNCYDFDFRRDYFLYEGDVNMKLQKGFLTSAISVTCVALTCFLLGYALDAASPGAVAPDSLMLQDIGAFSGQGLSRGQVSGQAAGLVSGQVSGQI